jgi:hypothetical protein
MENILILTGTIIVAAALAELHEWVHARLDDRQDRR